MQRKNVQYSLECINLKLVLKIVTGHAHRPLPLVLHLAFGAHSAHTSTSPQVTLRGNTGIMLSLPCGLTHFQQCIFGFCFCLLPARFRHSMMP